MIKYYCLSACRKCRDLTSDYFKNGCEYATRLGVPVKIIPLTTTENLNDYRKNVKPHRTSDKLPVWFDDKTNKELTDDEVRPGAVLQSGEYEAEEPNIPRRRRKDSAKTK